MSMHYYRLGTICVAVDAGEPGTPIRIGEGSTPRKAAADARRSNPLTVQVDGARCIDRALRHYYSEQQDVAALEELEAIEVTDADLDDRMEGWS